MSVTKIQFKRGLAATIPAATANNIGEPLWVTDSKKLFISNGNENVEVGAVTIENTLQSGTTIATINGTTIYSPANIKPDWNASSGADAEILNKPTIPAAVSYVAAGTTSSGIHTIGTLTIGPNSYPLSCPAPTISGTNDGTNWTSITIGNDTYSIPSGGGQTTGRDDELTAVTAGTGTVNLKTLQGSKYVTLRHDPIDQNNEGSVATFTVSTVEDGGADTGNRIVTMSITVIDGGSW